MIRMFDLMYSDEIDEVARKIYDFSWEWDRGECTSDEGEKKIMEEAQKLATELFKSIHGSRGKAK